MLFLFNYLVTKFHQDLTESERRYWCFEVEQSVLMREVRPTKKVKVQVEAVYRVQRGKTYRFYSKFTYTFLFLSIKIFSIFLVIQ